MPFLYMAKECDILCQGCGMAGLSDWFFGFLCHSPCCCALFFAPTQRHNKTCAGLRQMKYIHFLSFKQTSLSVFAIGLLNVLLCMCIRLFWDRKNNLQCSLL